MLDGLFSIVLLCEEKSWWVYSQGTAEDGVKRLWGGRFTGAQDPLMLKFNESISLDQRMWREDIEVDSTMRTRWSVVVWARGSLDATLC